MSFVNICRGYVFWKPVQALEPCSWMKNFISDEMLERSGDFYEFPTAAGSRAPAKPMNFSNPA